MKEPTATQPQRVKPFENRPLAILKWFFNDAVHVGRREAGSEHFAYLFAASHWRIRDLMVCGILGVHGRKRVRISAVERFYPTLNEFFRAHRCVPTEAESTSRRDYSPFSMRSRKLNCTC